MLDISGSLPSDTASPVTCERKEMLGFRQGLVSQRRRCKQKKVTLGPCEMAGH